NNEEPWEDETFGTKFKLVAQWTSKEDIRRLQEKSSHSHKKMNPNFCVSFSTTNIASAKLAMDLGWIETDYSISSACATGNFCILSSANHIIRGETDLMLCGGSAGVNIPIGTDGDGFVLREGAGVLLSEELQHAKARGAKIYAEFHGGSISFDAHHLTLPHPDGTGTAICIERALAQSGMEKDVLVGTRKERLEIKVALSNSFGFAGQNSTTLFAPYK
ncbi:unnamed protein product, partial [Linum tenue]